jgi:hypothetical protein
VPDAHGDSLVFWQQVTCIALMLPSPTSTERTPMRRPLEIAGIAWVAACRPSGKIRARERPFDAESAE